MKSLKKIVMSFVMLSMCLFVPMNVSAASIITKDEEALIGEVLSYYANYTEGDFNEDNGWTASAFTADVDIDRTLNELEEVNPSLGKAYRNIMDTWMYSDTTMPINKGVLPDGLPDDNSLCIVTLGFQLDQKTGEMQPELIDRLNVTLASAEKYPNAYIVVTGGGTSPANPNNTEGGEMSKWLIKHGVDEKRIIVEDRAPTTVGNAIYTFELLKGKPEVKSVAMISSASHIQRAIAIFETVFQLEAYKQGNDSIKILSNASCPVSRQERLSQQVSAVTQATNYCLSANITLTDRIARSTLTGIVIENVNDEYEVGAVVEPSIVATFKTNDDEEFTVDVTNRAVVQAIDTQEAGKKVLTATYSYNNETKEVSKEVVVKEKEEVVEPEVKPDTKPEVKPETKPEAKPEIDDETPHTGDATNTAFLWTMMLSAGAVIVALKARKCRV